jgi:hypothetical protein
MDAKLAAEAESFRRTAERLVRVGLIVDRAALSPAHRRAVCALECAMAIEPEQARVKRLPIGFAYPNAK